MGFYAGDLLVALGGQFGFEVGHVVLEAFSTLKNRKLVMIGNWDNSAYGRALREKYGQLQNIILLDPIYDQRTLDLIRGNASLVRVVNTNTPSSP